MPGTSRRPDCLLGIDAGGSTLKAAVFGRDGRLLGKCGGPLPAITVDALRRERDPAVMWSATASAVRGALLAAGCEAGDVAAVGITGYGNGLYLVDEQARPLMNGVLSSDRRAESWVARWRADGVADAHRRSCFQDLWPGKPLPLLAQLAQSDPGLLDRAYKLILCKDYLRAKLTGCIATDVTDAAASSLLAGQGRRDFERQFELLGLERWARLMPEVLEPTRLAGTVTPSAAEDLGLIAGTPVAVGLSDNAAMTCGSGAMLGDVNIVCGTWALHHTPVAAALEDADILACCQGAEPGQWLAIEGGTASASAFEWFLNAHAGLLQSESFSRDALYARINAAVMDLPQGSEGSEEPLIFLPHLNGAFDDAGAHGAFVGLSAEHSLGHIARAVYEGVAFEHCLHMDRVRRIVPEPGRVCFTGGAARSPVWAQIFADALELTLDIPEGEEIGALGAAMAAAVAIGWFPSLDAATAGMTRVRQRVSPQPQGVQALRRRRAAYAAARQHLQALWRMPAFRAPNRV